MPFAPASPRARRALLASLSGLVAAGLLAGCTADPATEAAADDASDATIDFSYEGFSATIPADPQRVVVLDSRSGLEMSLLADYPIVATAFDDDSPLSPLVDEDAAHLKNTAFDLNREEIASYDPDLIVVGSGWYNYYDGEDFALEEIAPLLAVNDGLDVEGATADDPFVAMTDQLTLLGREDLADDAIADYEAAIDEARAAIGDAVDGKSISIIHMPVDNFTVVSDDSIYQVVLPALGFTIYQNDEIDAAPANPNGAGHMLSYENAVSALGGTDALIVLKAEEDAELDPLLQRVPAVAAGHWINGNLAERFGFALTYAAFANGVADAVQGFDGF
jgi:iron complex transport system substrate-binding protein